MMVQRLMVCVLLCLVTPATAAEPEKKTQVEAEKRTRIEWVRRGATGQIRVTGTKTGGRHAEANRDLQNVADILDGIRTVERYVIWQRISWTDGRLSIDAIATTASFANVATITLRRFYPTYGSAGTGIKQLRGYPGFSWRIIAQLYPKKEAKRP